MVFHSGSEKLCLSTFLLFAETLCPHLGHPAFDCSRPAARAAMRQATYRSRGGRKDLLPRGGELRTFHFEVPMWTSPVTPTSYHCKSSALCLAMG